MTSRRSPVTAPALARRKRAAGDPALVMITAYDHHAARLADQAGVDVLLVGDSLGMVVQGRADTLGVTIGDVAYHCRCVSSAGPSALVVADMPWLSYHVDAADAVRNAGRLVQEGGAAAVKLEGGTARVPAIRAILDAEIPVMGHVGLTPQSVHAMGGYRVQGRDARAAERIRADARALEHAGVFAVVLEGVPADLAATITADLSVPTIGIGAGIGCDGQVLVWHDLLGLTPDPVPRFVRRYEQLGDRTLVALREFVADVRAGTFPADEESYHAPRAMPRPAPAGEV